NILEFMLYDEDTWSPDDLISRLQFDIKNLTIGQKETKEFVVHAEAGPFSSLDVDVQNLQRHDSFRNKVLKLRGAYPENHTFNGKETCKRFYINRDLETELGVADEIKLDLHTHDGTEETFGVRLDFDIPSQEKEFLKKRKDVVAQALQNFLGLGSLPQPNKDEIKLDLHTHDGTEETFGVRLDFDIPSQEKEFLKKRKDVVAQALQNFLGLGSLPQPNKVPTIAVVASGGGSRAMTGMLGSLKGLKDTGVLDAVVISLVFLDPHGPCLLCIRKITEQITKSVLSGFSPEKLQYYSEETAKKEQEGHPVSLVDNVGLLLEHLVFGKKIDSTLSEQQRAVNEGQNPLPIYTAVNIKDGISGCEHASEWCEFTPYEVGIPKYGAFVRSEDFGSQFFLGRIIKKIPEVRIPYLMGIWSSVFSVSLCKLVLHFTGTSKSSNTSDEPDEVIAEMYNFMCGLFLHWDYNTHSNFLAWKDTHPDAFPNQLTPSDSTLRLVDSGLDINIGCVPILRPERDVDVIICLNYSWDEDNIFKVLQTTAAYCENHNIPFPNADYASLDKEPQEEVYIIEDQENPKAPIVVHFPLVNVTFKDFKQPGVKRETEEELKAGEVDVRSTGSPYITKNMTYSKEDYEALVELTAYNISNSKERIREALCRALEKKN
ncbi:hypothetical protein JOQ06_020082, partial [Pogonophryne albipinna]